jgi:hypothetical protein
MSGTCDFAHVIRRKTNAPIFSIPILGSKIYVVASPKLISTVQRLTKSLAFEPIIAMATSSVAGCSTKAQAIINRNIDGSEGPRGYVITFSKAIHSALMPGPSLDSMNRIMIQNIAASADRLAGDSPLFINLFKWLRHEITMATTNAVYGPANPYTDPVIENAFWYGSFLIAMQKYINSLRDFEENLMMLLVNVVPSVTARAGIKARSTVAGAFHTYFTQNAYLKGSDLVQARYNHSRDYDVPVGDIATFEVGGSLAVLANTFPTAYWMLIYIYSHDDVLRDCRDEVSKIAKTTQNDDGSILHSIDMTTIKSSRPVITATLQEALRHTAVGATVRKVMEDTVIDDYQLKKGCTLLTPANVLHTDSDIWGPNTNTFDHRRFLKAPGKKMPVAVAFRAFDGGSTPCPGRHFATTEVLALTTMFIARFDMSAVGEWPQPDRTSAQFWTQILGPNRKFEVQVRERIEYGVGHKWTFNLTDSEILLAMAAEDLGSDKGH